MSATGGMGETDRGEVFIDGTKIEKPPIRYTFVWRKQQKVSEQSKRTGASEFSKKKSQEM